MIFEFALIVARSWRGGGVERFAQNFFRGARLRGQLRETQKKGFGDAACAQREDGDGLRLGRGLQDDGV